MATYLTVQEVADMLKISRYTVYRLIRSNRLEAVRVGKLYRISRASLDAYLDVNRVAKTELQLTVKS